jgi:hypothetical protein
MCTFQQMFLGRQHHERWDGRDVSQVNIARLRYCGGIEIQDLGPTIGDRFTAVSVTESVSSCCVSAL